MGKSAPQAPAAPDPFATAKAQTGSNVGTAIANTFLGNANDIGPLGSVDYTQTGSHPVNDGQGNIFDVPSFTRYTQLSPNEQLKLEQSQAIQLGLLGLGWDQLGQVQSALSQPLGGFDPNQYLANNPDVAAAAKRSPMKDISQFNAQSYLSANPDVAAGYKPSYNFNPAEYLQIYGDVRSSAGGDARGPDQFNAQGYLAANPDVAAAGVDPWEHYSQFGKAEGRTGGFETPEQFAQRHWNEYGQAEGRQGGLTPSETQDQYALRHWQQFGQNEQRSGSGLEDPTAFARQHYNQFGQAEGRALPDNLPAAVSGISQFLPSFQQFGNNLPQLQEYGAALPQMLEVGQQRPDLMEYDAGRLPQMLEVGQQRPDLLEAEARPDLLEYGMQDFSGNRQVVEDALWSRLNPQLERDRTALDVQLTNEGFTRGSEAYNRAMDEFTRQSNDARMQVVLAGSQEDSRLAGLRLAQIQADNAARQGEYGMSLQGVDTTNAARQGEYANLLSQVQSDNAARQAGHTQYLEQLNATNASRQGEYSNLLAQVAADNQARQAGHNQLLEQINANNAARQGMFGNQMAALQNDNALRQTGFGNQLQAAQFANTSRERAIQEQLLRRQTPLNEASAILNGGQVNMPQFSPYQGGTVAPTPIGDFVYRGFDTASKNFQTQQQAAALQNAGLFGAGSNLLTGLFKISDRRLKRDIAPIADGLYRYRYNWDDEWEIGVMADEVAHIPGAVIERGGVKLVNYGALQ